MTKMFDDCGACNSQGVFTWDMTVVPPKPLECPYCHQHKANECYVVLSNTQKQLVSLFAKKSMHKDSLTYSMWTITELKRFITFCENVKTFDLEKLK